MASSLHPQLPGIHTEDQRKSKYKRILLKLSGEAQGKTYKLADGSTLVAGFDTEKMRQEAKEIKSVIEDLEIELVIVIGGGNIFRGKDAVGINKNTADYMGMLATVQNAMAFEHILNSEGVEAVMNSSLRIEEVAEPYLFKKASRRLQKGQVVICAGGLGEPGFTTDTAAAQRAMNLGCEAILMAKQGTDGIYTGDPKTNPDAIKMTEMTHLEVILKDLKVMDATAATHAKEHAIEIVVYEGNQPGMLAKVLCHPEIHGTLVRTAA
jgi:uridylate kinase